MPRHALSARQRGSYAAHLYKALVRQHHRALGPILQRHIPRDAVVVDAGAHAGQFCKLFASLAPEGRIYAFEPGSYARSILKRVVRWRRLTGVTVIAAGLSDVEGEGELSVPLKASGSLGFGLGNLGAVTSPARRESIALTTLDGLVREQALARLDFIKADIEGWEVRMLEGASEALSRFRPAMLLELVAAHLGRAGSAPDEAWEILRPWGYGAERLHGLERTGLKRAPADEGFLGDGDYLFSVSGR